MKAQKGFNMMFVTLHSEKYRELGEDLKARLVALREMKNLHPGFPHPMEGLEMVVRPDIERTARLFLSHDFHVYPAIGLKRNEVFVLTYAPNIPLNEKSQLELTLKRKVGGYAQWLCAKEVKAFMGENKLVEHKSSALVTHIVKIESPPEYRFE